MLKKYIYIYMHTQKSWTDDRVQDSRESQRPPGRGDWHPALKSKVTKPWPCVTRSPVHESSVPLACHRTCRRMVKLFYNLKGQCHGDFARVSSKLRWNWDKMPSLTYKMLLVRQEGDIKWMFARRANHNKFSMIFVRYKHRIWKRPPDVFKL